MSKNALSKNEIVQQSQGAMNQWGELWRKNIVENKKVTNRSSFKDFENMGVGKVMLLVGNGYSFEENIDVIKKYRNNIDILCCDKTLGHLIENDIIPDFCMVCDAQVSFEKYLEPYVDKIGDIVLFATVTANPKWLKQNWKSVCQYVNQDAIHSEKEFGPLSGIKNDCIPAATNVSNAMVVLCAQAKNTNRANRFGYDKYVLIGFDYSWRRDGKYYSFNERGDGKANYMRHAYVLMRDGTSAYSSNNLIFSAKWLQDYVVNFKLPVVNGTDKTILNGVPTKDLSQQLKYQHKVEDGITVRAMIDLRDTLAQNLKNVENKLNEIGADHWLSYRNSI